MTRPARLGDDLDAVPVANATERTAPTWEARALAAEARLAELESVRWEIVQEVGQPTRARIWVRDVLRFSGVADGHQ